LNAKTNNEDGVDLEEFIPRIACQNLANTALEFVLHLNTQYERMNTLSLMCCEESGQEKYRDVRSAVENIVAICTIIVASLTKLLQGHSLVNPQVESKRHCDDAYSGKESDVEHQQTERHGCRVKRLFKTLAIVFRR
jgi:hypothetical protein